MSPMLLRQTKLHMCPSAPSREGPLKHAQWKWLAGMELSRQAPAQPQGQVARSTEPVRPDGCFSCDIFHATHGGATPHGRVQSSARHRRETTALGVSQTNVYTGSLVPDFKSLVPATRRVAGHRARLLQRGRVEVDPSTMHGNEQHILWQHLPGSHGHNRGSR